MMTGKRIVVYARQRHYYIICRKHPIVADMLIIDEGFESTHCEFCCEECHYSFKICEKRDEDLQGLIYYYRKMAGVTVSNPFLEGAIK